MLRGGVGKGPELGGGPHLPRFGMGLAGPFGALDRIGRQERPSTVGGCRRGHPQTRANAGFHPSEQRM